MTEFRTHYDNLKVARDAPDIVIRAAYKSLSQRFHPDKNPGDERAVGVMAVINRSYEVLSDPKRRAEHDEWISREEARLKSHGSQSAGAQIPPEWRPSRQPVTAMPPHRNLLAAALLWPFKIVLRITVAVPQLALLGLLFGGFALYDAITPDRPPPTGPKPYTSTPVTLAAKPSYTRPTTAPNGAPWPKNANYIEGLPLLAKDGMSKITVDNRQNDSDVFVKLVSLDEAQAFPARQFYIPAHSQFTLNRVTAGNYDIRYRDQESGGLSRSEAFHVEERRTDRGVQYSTITMTLYKVQDGNLQTYDLAESEF